jgi:hypothetical protein
MITKEELHKLIDECDIEKLNNKIINIQTGQYTNKISLPFIQYFIESCKYKDEDSDISLGDESTITYPNSKGNEFHEMYTIMVAEFMSSENDHLLAKELYQKIQNKYKFSDDDMQWYHTEFKKRQNHEV